MGLVYIDCVLNSIPGWSEISVDLVYDRWREVYLLYIRRNYMYRGDLSFDDELVVFLLAFHVDLLFLLFIRLCTSFYVETHSSIGLRRGGRRVLGFKMNSSDAS